MAVFENAQGEAVPDPVTYSEWFAQAGEKERRLAVGSRRYSAVVDLLGADPPYDAFVDRKGEVIGLDALQSEGAKARTNRQRIVREIIDRRRGLLAQVAAHGFLP